MKRFVIFISSTKQSLTRERNSVINAILRMSYMPASMEFFSASERKTWSYIQNIIDDSDYYILILGTKYGSIDPETNLSYTEREYQYAVSLGLPILAFLRNDVLKLAPEMFDDRKKVLDFHSAVQNQRLVEFWKNRNELVSQVTTSLMKQIDERPRVGWIRGDTGLVDLFKHPAGGFITENIAGLLKKPYRENLEARVVYNFARGGEFLKVQDKVSYKCRMVNGSITKKIVWSVHESELNDFIKISINIQKPDGTNVTVLKEKDFNGKISDHEYKFEHVIGDEWNIDNLLVVVEAFYYVPADHFVSWEMPELTYQFTLTMIFPKKLELFYVPYMLKYRDRDVTTRAGFSSYKFFNWLLPNEGLTWQFRKKNITRNFF